MKDEIEQEPFLNEDSNSHRETRWSSTPKSWYRSGVWVLSILLVLNLVAVVINLAAVFRDTSRPLYLHNAEYSPAKSAIEYEERYLKLKDYQSPYSGKPRPEMDAAWDKLLNFTTIEVTEDELRAANKTTLMNAETGHYMGFLSVYHQLHCVKTMIQVRYREHYPHLVAAGRLSDGHFDHCLEVLRQNIMCRGDIHFSTFTWDETQPRNFDGVPDGTRTCINWERLQDWARQRRPGKRVTIGLKDGVGFQGPPDLAEIVGDPKSWIHPTSDV